MGSSRLIYQFNRISEEPMTEREGLVTVGGNPVTLTGDVINIGDIAPDCMGANSDLAPVALSSYRGKVIILSFVVSLDTATCDIETRRFNAKAAGLGSDVKIITVSMDLPFAQKRWCSAAGIENVVTLSDYKERCFGERYGMMIKQTGLLARGVFIIDKQGVVKYIQIVPEVADEPDYDAILINARQQI
jgi:thiol peroxidase